MSGLKQTRRSLPRIAVTLLATLTPWLIFIGLMYVISLYNFLLFHSLAELFTVSVAVAVFMLAWNTRRFTNSDFLLLIGACYLFPAFIDLMHTLAYKGMGVFPSDDANLPTQFWIAARYLQSVSFLAAVWLMGKKLNHRLVLGAMSAATVLLLAAIAAGLFPDCYVNGLTPFKKISEYVISAIFVVAGLRLGRASELFSRRIHTLIRLSILFTVAAELTFTVYVNVYAVSNFFGHIFRIFAIYCIYQCVIATGLNQPFDLLFHGMKRRELELETSQKLLQEIATRDQVTGLPNRLLFDTRLTHALEKARRESHADRQHIVQVMIMDVDDFKRINDLLGHLGGDEVLREIGRRLQAEMRASDTVARWGGDEFACILEDLPNSDMAQHTAHKILTAMAAPVRVQEHELKVGVSLGYSLFPLDSDRAETLLRYADIALYRAKQTKRSFRAYDGSMNRRTQPLV